MWDENQKVYTFGNSSPQAHGKKQAASKRVSPKFISQHTPRA